MELFSLLLVLNLSLVQEPKIKRLSDEEQIEILNSIDDFKQYHTNSFKVNLFRRVSSENKELNGFPLANYIIGIVNYSEMDNPYLFQVGDFHSPQIASATRQVGSLKITIEYGKSSPKEKLILIVTKDGVKLVE